MKELLASFQDLYKGNKGFVYVYEAECGRAIATELNVHVQFERLSGRMVAIISDRTGKPTQKIFEGMDFDTGFILIGTMDQFGEFIWITGPNTGDISPIFIDILKRSYGQHNLLGALLNACPRPVPENYIAPEIKALVPPGIHLPWEEKESIDPWIEDVDICKHLLRTEVELIKAVLNRLKFIRTVIRIQTAIGFDELEAIGVPLDTTNLHVFHSEQIKSIEMKESSVTINLEEMDPIDIDYLDFRSIATMNTSGFLVEIDQSEYETETGNSMFEVVYRRMLTQKTPD